MIELRARLIASCESIGIAEDPWFFYRRRLAWSQRGKQRRRVVPPDLKNRFHGNVQSVNIFARGTTLIAGSFNNHRHLECFVYRLHSIDSAKKRPALILASSASDYVPGGRDWPDIVAKSVRSAKKNLVTNNETLTFSEARYDFIQAIQYQMDQWQWFLRMSSKL